MQFGICIGWVMLGDNVKKRLSQLANIDFSFVVSLTSKCMIGIQDYARFVAKMYSITS